MPHRRLNVLDAAQRAADGITELIDRFPRLLHVSQLRRSALSISANISDAFGRRPGRDRNHSLEIARGETEEAIQHLSANFRTNESGQGSIGRGTICWSWL